MEAFDGRAELARDGRLLQRSCTWGQCSCGSKESSALRSGSLDFEKKGIHCRDGAWPGCPDIWRQSPLPPPHAARRNLPDSDTRRRRCPDATATPRATSLGRAARARRAPSAGRDLEVPPETRHTTHVRFSTQHVSGRTLRTVRTGHFGTPTWPRRPRSCPAPARSVERNSLFFKPRGSGVPPP